MTMHQRPDNSSVAAAAERAANMEVVVTMVTGVTAKVPGIRLVQIQGSATHGFLDIAGNIRRGSISRGVAGPG